MKKIIYSVVIMTVLVLALHSSGQAAVVNNLVEAPTADLINRQGAVGLEFDGDTTRLEGVYLIDPRVEVGLELTSNWRGYLEPGPLVKIKIASETHNQPALAVGLRKKDLYLAASKKLGNGFRGHLGIGDGRYGGLYVGLNKVINPITVEIQEEGEGSGSSNSTNFPPINLMAEYVNQEFNLGGRVNFYPGFYFDLHVLGFDSTRVGLSYSF